MSPDNECRRGNRHATEGKRSIKMHDGSRGLRQIILSHMARALYDFPLWWSSRRGCIHDVAEAQPLTARCASGLWLHLAVPGGLAIVPCATIGAAVRAPLLAAHWTLQY